MLPPIGQFFIGGFDGTRVTKQVRTLIEKYQISGFVLFSRNIKDFKQVKKLIQDLQDMSEKPLLIGVDQEGGRVARLKTPFVTLPPMQKFGDYYRKTKDADLIRSIATCQGMQLAELGFNWDYVPVLDVQSNPENPVIGDRSFGPDPHQVAICAEAIIRGMNKAGILTCGKHFPGHGATDKDSHLELPVVRQMGRLIWKRDVTPYRILIEKNLIKSIMTAHVLYPDMDPDYCATLSPIILGEMLRKKLNYDGVVVSDDFFMKAIKDNIGLLDASLKFFEAGGDLVMICHEPDTQIKVMEQVSRVIDQYDDLDLHLMQAYQRILRFKSGLKKKSDITGQVGNAIHQALVDQLIAAC